MSIIDRVLADIETKIKCRKEWHVEILSKAKTDTAQEKDSYLWDAESPVAAQAIKDYLVATGMNNGTLSDPEGSWIYAVKMKRHKAL